MPRPSNTVEGNTSECSQATSSRYARLFLTNQSENWFHPQNIFTIQKRTAILVYASTVSKRAQSVSLPKLFPIVHQTITKSEIYRTADKTELRTKLGMTAEYQSQDVCLTGRAPILTFVSKRVARNGVLVDFFWAPAGCHRLIWQQRSHILQGVGKNLCRPHPCRACELQSLLSFFEYEPTHYNCMVSFRMDDYGFIFGLSFHDLGYFAHFLR